MNYIRVFVLSFFLSFSTFGQFTYEHLKVDYASSITYKNLQIIPIRGNNSFFEASINRGMQATRNYLPLRDALEGGNLIIRDQAGVNRLLIDNLSNQPVMLMSGEILTGGKQDRVIGQDMVLPPNTRRNRVPVYCVEKERWSSPKKWKYYHEGSMHLRRVVDQSQNQQQVWQEIAYELKQDKISSNTQAYTSHSKNRQYATLEAEYLQVFKFNSFSDSQNIVGLIGISGNVVIGCDIVASAELFQREYEGLIFSYVDEAITYGLPVNIAGSSIKQYADNLLSNERMQQAFIRQYGKAFMHNGRLIHITTFNDRETLQNFEAFD